MRTGLLLLLFAAATVGCEALRFPDQPPTHLVHPSDCPTQGPAHRAAFSYTGSTHDPSFGYGCNFLSNSMGLAERAIAVGADAQIQVVLDGDEGYAGVASSAPAVATFSLGKLWYESPGVSLVIAHGVSAGQADFILLTPSGAELDRATVKVDVPDGVELGTIASQLTVPLVLEDAAEELAARATKDGTALVGVGAVRFEPIGDVTLEPGGRGIELYDQVVAFRGKSGQAGVRAIVGNDHREISFQVVGTGELTKIVLDHFMGRRDYIAVQGFVGDQPVTGVGCGWSIDPRDDVDVGETVPLGVNGPFADTRYYVFEGRAGGYRPICFAPGWRTFGADVTVPK